MLTFLGATEVDDTSRTIFFTEIVMVSNDETIKSEHGLSENEINLFVDSLLNDLASKGFPFSSVLPEIIISEINSINIIVDSGVKVDSLKFEVVNSDPLKSYLLYTPIGATREFDIEYLDQTLDKVKMLPYVRTAQLGQLMYTSNEESVSLIAPLLVESQRNFLFDGSVLWSSEDGGGLVGYLDLSLLNLFWSGEELTFEFYGDEVSRRASFELSLPFVFRLPLEWDLWGGFEVGDQEYGYNEIGGRARYRIGSRWSAGLGFEYSEFSESDFSRKYRGISLVMKRSRHSFVQGEYQWGIELEAGSGVSIQGGDKNPRGNVNGLFEFQWPLTEKLAIGSNFYGGVIATPQPDSLHSLEKIRIGGVNSLRGYSENQYSFIATGISQSELRLYLNSQGMVFLFGDFGAGANREYSVDSMELLFGYGVGLRIPTQRIVFSLAWARHVSEPLGPGRIHFGIGN